MKELSIEEKAKAYNEASKWMEGIYPTLTHEQQMEAEAFFPKLKESEDEDKAVLDALIRRLEGEDVYVSPNLAAECLKSLKERVQTQPKQEWSVEDRSKIRRICKYLNEVEKYYTGIEVSYADITEVRECIEWLKALIP